MSEQYQPICVERILLSLDSSSHSFSALKAAVKLARHYDASIKGVFIQDSMLLNLAKLPFFREIGEYTAISREISTEGITRGIIVQSRWVIRTFHKVINQSGINGNFFILRGKVHEILENESKNCDLLIIGKTGTNPLGRPRLGSTARLMVRKNKKPLLLVEEDNELGYPIFVLFDDSALGWVSLETARDYLDPGETLNIILNDDNLEIYKLNQAKIREWAIEKKINISFQSYQSRNFERFLETINFLKTGLLVLPHVGKNLDKTVIERILEKVSLPTLLIRSAEKIE